ncbi:hypothetical protein [Pedobacter sp. L105]|uniref:hypothetical protein n=1 Tax=Pedobacter sp. L105 TaxID=1641871 RepID=UPI00131D78AD|nr:hypothetical protein [Pedobacter sp. L105]
MKLLLASVIITSVAVSVFSPKKELKGVYQPINHGDFPSHLPKMQFSCADSTKYRGDSIVTFYGDAIVSYADTTIRAEVISVYRKKNNLKAWKNARVIVNNNQKEVKGLDSLTYKF